MGEVFQSDSNGDLPARPFSLYVIDHFADEVLQINAGGLESSPFQSLERLLRRPAYIAMFLKHLHEGRGYDATIPLLFLQRAGSYYHFTKNMAEGKDAKRQAQSIYNTFLTSDAPWTFNVPHKEVENVGAWLAKTETPVEDVANVFNSLAVSVANDMDKQLETYHRTLKAEDDDETLQEDIARFSEYHVTQKLLCLLIPTNSFTAQDSAYAVALSNMALTWGMDQKLPLFDRLSNLHQKSALSARNSNPTFTRSGSKGRHHVHVIAGHSFVATHYNSPTFCDYCNGLLWGLGNQGYTCQLCNYNVHKQTCNQSIAELCRGEPREGPSSLFRRGSLKPSFSGSFRSSPRQLSPRNSMESDLMASSASNSTQSGSFGRRKEMRSGSGTSLSSGWVSPSPNDTRSSCGSIGNFSSFSVSEPSPVSTLQRDQAGIMCANQKAMRAQSMKTSTAEHPILVMCRTRLTYEPPSPIATHRCRSNPSDSVASERAVKSPLQHRESDVFLNSATIDPDLDVDEDLVPWSCTATEQCSAGMSKQEIKRQDLLHELIHTERTHVKKLKVLQLLFCAPLLEADILATSMVQALFPGLDSLVDFHVDLMQSLRGIVDNGDLGRIGDAGGILADKFMPEARDKMWEDASNWVKLRQLNLDYIKHQSLKMPRLVQWLQHGEANPLCSRLKLADLSSVVMQRFTKYPLLLAGILKVTDKEKQAEDCAHLSKAIDCCRMILQYINHSVMEFENNCSLYSLQNRLDMKNMERLVGPMAAYRNLDISKGELIHRCDLKWRHRAKTVSVDALLLSDMLLLLEHNEDKTRHSLRIRDEYIPILPLVDLLPPREVAADKERKSFLLVSLAKPGSKMYEFSASTADSCVNWSLKLSDAIAAAKAGVAGVESPSFQENIQQYMLRAPISNPHSVGNSTEHGNIGEFSRQDSGEEKHVRKTTSRTSMSSEFSLSVLEDQFPVSAPTSPRGAGRSSLPSTSLGQSGICPRRRLSSGAGSPRLVSLLADCMAQVELLSGLVQEPLAADSGGKARTSSRSTLPENKLRVIAAIDGLKAKLKLSLDISEQMSSSSPAGTIRELTSSVSVPFDPLRAYL